MNNFLEFIKEDITAKKTLIDTLPTKTKINKKNYNEKIDSILERYELYKAGVAKYLNAKENNLKVKAPEKNIDALTEVVSNLEHARFVLNPQNTYVEKMGFDSLLYEINHYSEFQFNSLNKILNDFIDKFELVNIRLRNEDFNYTCYVKEYMSAFLEVRRSENKKYEKVSKIFEQIYWLNPNLVEHIELNLRSLIKKYSKEFEKYIQEKQKQVKMEHNIKTYDDCLYKLRNAYTELYKAEEEDIYDIVKKSQTGEIDVSDLLENSKVRTDAYTSLSIDSLNLDNKDEISNFYRDIAKLRENLIEYSSYREFIPLMNDFKKTYEKYATGDKKDVQTELKNLESKIKEKEEELFKLNKKLETKPFFFQKKLSLEEEKILKTKTVNLAKEIYKMYKNFEKEYFKSKVLITLNSAFTISNFLELYYSFDYFKKTSIKRVFEIDNYEELIEFSENFDLFAMNLNNKIMSGVFLFDKEDVSNVIVKKYRLSKININDDDLHTDNIHSVINKINLLIRIKKIEESDLTVDQIWFMRKVKEINSKNKK